MENLIAFGRYQDTSVTTGHSRELLDNHNQTSLVFQDFDSSLTFLR